MLPRAVAPETMQPVTRRHTQIGEAGGSVNCFQLPQSASRDIRLHSLRLPGAEQFLRPAIGEGFDHSVV